MDCDAPEINNRVKGVLPVVTGLRHFCTTMSARKPLASSSRAAWLSELEEGRLRFPDRCFEGAERGLSPLVFLKKLGQASASAEAFVFDVGQHQMWAAQSLFFRAHQRILNSGGMGAMGFSLPAAIGSSFARGKKPVVAITGDGALQVNL